MADHAGPRRHRRALQRDRDVLTATTRAWLLRRTGGPDVLSSTEVEVREPGPHEISVRVEAIGINYAEVLSRKGLYGWAPKRPYVPGMEAVGRVEAVGAAVTDRSVGQQVICGMQHGAYAERVVLSAKRSWQTFDDFSVEENAAFGVNFLTAWVGLVEMARLRPTDRVGITAAAGGVGTAAVQIAHATGCRIVAMAGSDEKAELVLELGADAFVNYRGPDFRTRLREAIRAEGLDVVLEVVGGDVYRACLGSLANFGRIVVAGYAGLDYRLWNPLSWLRAWRDAPRVSVTEAAVASIGVMATHVGYLLPDEERLAGLWRDLSDFTLHHGLRPRVGATFPFDRLPDSHRLMESRRSQGKIVVRVG